MTTGQIAAEALQGIADKCDVAFTEQGWKDGEAIIQSAIEEARKIWCPPGYCRAQIESRATASEPGAVYTGCATESGDGTVRLIRPSHHNTCPKGERCACYLTGYTDAEYDHGLALDKLPEAPDAAELVDARCKVFDRIENWHRFCELLKRIDAAMMRGKE